jgi:pimeloyl-ACP methyl ester carboxylesterase
MPPLRDATVTLPDGRRLAYTEWGLPDGEPVLGFHGTPGTRLWCPDEAATTAAGVRLIMPDRPGIGRSDPLAPRSLADWPKDVERLADALGLSAFGVIGISAGGSHAAACAALIPGRLRGAALVACRALSEYNWAERPTAREEWSPEERAEFDLAQVDPIAAADLTVQHAADWIEQLDEHPEIMQKQLETAADGDRWFFEDPSRVATFEATMRDWRRQGVEAIKWELIEVFLPWGFRLADISIPVTIWFGSQDHRIKHMDFQAKAIPQSSVFVWPDSGHLGVAKHWSEILEAVV